MRLITCVIVPAILTAGTGFAAQDSVVTGQYLEQRSNRVYGCPCEFSAEWADAGRTVVLAWRIAAGEYGGQRLDGLRLVAVIAADFSLSVTIAAPRSSLFVDRTAPAAQQRAGLDWLRSRYGALLGRVLGEHPADIDFQFDANSAGVRVNDFLAVRMRRADVANDVESWAFALFDPLTALISPALGLTLQDEYSGPDLNMRWSRGGTPIAGYFGLFRM